MTLTYIRRDYTPDEEEAVRILTHPNGRHNSAYDPELNSRMLPQDRLLEAEVTLGKTTGIAIEFRWASGRKDVYAVLDLPKECVSPKVIRERRQLIKQRKEQYAA